MLWDDLEGWDRGRGGREAQEGDICIHVLTDFIVQQKHNIVKQLYSN